MSERINISIVESSEAIRCGIATFLRRSPNFTCEIVEASDLSTLLSGAVRQIPELLIINPSQLGLYPFAQLRAELGSDSLKVVALQSAFIEPTLLQNYDEVLSIYDSSEVMIQKVDKVLNLNEEPDEKKGLSMREKEIIVCVVKGQTNKQIADTLCISTHTVIAHRRNIATKLQIHSPSGLTIYAIVNKLVDLSEIKNSITQSREEE